MKIRATESNKPVRVKINLSFKDAVNKALNTPVTKKQATKPKAKQNKKSN